MTEFRERHSQRASWVVKSVSKKIRDKLGSYGVQDEKIIAKIIEKFTKHLRPKEYETKQEQILDSINHTYEQCPLIVVNNIELKHYLGTLAGEFGIAGDIDIDNGHSFTYQVQVFFPTHFQKQVQALQFDLYDSSNQADAETLEKLARNLGTSKAAVTQQFSLLAEIERKKSVLGRVNLEENVQKMRQNADSKAKGETTFDFITFDESEFKLKRADWLDLVSFEGQAPECLKRQSNFLSQAKDYDNLLESAFNFLDVNDSAAVNRILEEASQIHA